MSSRMKSLGLAFVFSVFCTAAQALPEGDWLADFYGDVGTIRVTPSSFSFEINDGGEAAGFEGPLADVREAIDGNPGRIIVGPVKNGKFSYEVVWFYGPDGPRTHFYCELEGFQSLAAAKDIEQEFAPSQASLFLAREYYERVDRYPPISILDKAGLLALLQEAKRLYQERPDDELSGLMEAMLIGNGFHPKKSREPFEAAVQKYASERDVAQLLAELGWRHQDVP